MLAGYLPFDDDPANPEGDNINLLYKYIVTTPLTFPEYVTPHARDLLRRILVPNPRKRADLFEVARHSWLSEYAHLVEFITSSTTLPSDVQEATVAPDDYLESQMTRSSSVREASRQKAPHPSSVGGLSKAHGKIDNEVEQQPQRTPKDAKRRTVQVEYVAPTTQTQRGAESGGSTPASRSTSRRDAQEAALQDKPLPQDPPVSRDAYGRITQGKRPPSAHRNAHPTRGSQIPRTAADNAYAANAGSTARPQTGGSMQSANSASLQSRGNYGQPAPPAMADTNAQGRIQQPLDGDEHEAAGRSSVGGVPPKFARISAYQSDSHGGEGRGHKRSNTLGDLGNKLLGRNTSVFGGRNKKQVDSQGEKSKKYPPVSMANTVPGSDEPGARPSMDSKFSRRSASLGIGKKRSGSMNGSQGSGEKRDRRRFSLLPASFSLKAIGLGKDYDSGPPSSRDSQQDLPIRNARGDHVRSVTAHGDARGSGPFFDDAYNRPQQDTASSSPVYHQRQVSAQMDNRRPNAMPPYLQSAGNAQTGSDPMIEARRPPTEPQLGSYQHNLAQSEGYDGRRIGSSRGGSRGVLQKGHKRFNDAYEQDNYRGHEGSSGAAKRVMDFFRRRGKARGGEER